MGVDITFFEGDRHFELHRCDRDYMHFIDFDRNGSKVHYLKDHPRPKKWPAWCWKKESFYGARSATAKDIRAVIPKLHEYNRAALKSFLKGVDSRKRILLRWH